MKIYCQFLKLSTGYIEGSIPPRFEDWNKKPIEVVGSDGVMYLDGRMKVSTLFPICYNEMLNRGFIGFKIVRASSFSENGRLITNYIIPKTIQ